MSRPFRGVVNLPEFVAVDVGNRDFTIGAQVDLPDGGAEGVTQDYPGEAPWPFTGGVLHRVAVDVLGEPHLDLEREAAAMLSRE
jgi:hypothetical protein